MAFLGGVAALAATFSLVSGQSTEVLNLLSRPDIVAPYLEVLEVNQSLVTPGYVFFTPNSPGKTNFQYGPYIYNNQGHLVYSGYKLLTPGYGAFDPQVVKHEGEDMLMFTQFAGPRGGGPAFGGSYTEIFNNTYHSVTRVKPIGSINGQKLTHDLHEFNVVGDEGQTALITSYVTIERNITFHNCPGKPVVRYIKDGAFSEIATDGSNANLFQQAFIDLVDPSDTFVCPGDNLVGDGNHSNDGFDYLHINSIDKDIYGDFLVSCRHLNAVYKIAGSNNPEGYAPGTKIWQLGGRANDFPVMDSEVPTSPNLNFSFQHHARWAPEIEGITLWDNANNAITEATAASSSGMDIRLGKGTATLIGQWISPGQELDSSQGSYQQLESGNHFLGLGSFPAIYELTPDGQTAFYAQFGPVPLQSYRSFKFNWTGFPSEDEIGFFAFALSCEDDMAFYSSWNGATEVDSWHYFTSPDNETFDEVAWMPHGGTFETFTTGPRNLYAFAKAFMADGTLLGQSKVVKTWVAPEDMAGDCQIGGCSPGTKYVPSKSLECPAMPRPENYDKNSTEASTTDANPVALTEDPEEAANDTPDRITDAIDSQPPQDHYFQPRRMRRHVPALEERGNDERPPRLPRGNDERAPRLPRDDGHLKMSEFIPRNGERPPRLPRFVPSGERKSTPKGERMG